VDDWRELLVNALIGVAYVAVTAVLLIALGELVLTDGSALAWIIPCTADSACADARPLPYTRERGERRAEWSERGPNPNSAPPVSQPDPLALSSARLSDALHSSAT